MQSIKRTDLQTIFTQVCTTWQSRIKKVLTEQLFSDEISVKDEDIEEAYSNADENQKKLLKQFFTLPQSIFDRIQSIEDVYTLLNIKRALPFPQPANKLERYLNACYDIPHITKAYNGAVILDWANSNQNKFFLYWEKNASGRWVVDVVFYDYCFAYLGFGCYFATRDGANDAGSKFASIFIDYLPE